MADTQILPRLKGVDSHTAGELTRCELADPFRHRVPE